MDGDVFITPYLPPTMSLEMALGIVNHPHVSLIPEKIVKEAKAVLLISTPDN